MCRNVLDSPEDLSPPAFPGFRREARLTPGYARPAFQAEEQAAAKCVYPCSGRGRGFAEANSSASALLSPFSLLRSRTAGHPARRSAALEASALQNDRRIYGGRYYFARPSHNNFDESQKPVISLLSNQRCSRRCASPTIGDDSRRRLGFYPLPVGPCWLDCQIAPAETVGQPNDITRSMEERAAMSLRRR